MEAAPAAEAGKAERAPAAAAAAAAGDGQAAGRWRTQRTASAPPTTRQ